MLTGMEDYEGQSRCQVTYNPTKLSEGRRKALTKDTEQIKMSNASNERNSMDNFVPFTNIETIKEQTW